MLEFARLTPSYGLVLLPDEAEVSAEVLGETQDVSFVREGQFAEIKLDTFPATLVLDCSAIDVESKQIRLAPGMTLAAEIRTGKRHVLDCLLSLVRHDTHEGMRERYMD